jgi:hypothetical protein
VCHLDQGYNIVAADAVMPTLGLLSDLAELCRICGVSRPTGYRWEAWVRGAGV